MFWKKLNFLENNDEWSTKNVENEIQSRKFRMVVYIMKTKANEDYMRLMNENLK